MGVGVGVGGNTETVSSPETLKRFVEKLETGVESS